ncbi:MAG: translocation/assembly module TamB domain-containing protein, partial [Acidithiobacillales bacterium]
MAKQGDGSGPAGGRRHRVRIPHPHLPHLTLTQVRVLRLFGLLLVLFLLVLYAVARSVRFQELLRRRAEMLLTERLGRPVAIGSFDLYLIPPAFVVRNVRLANDPRGVPGPCFAAAEIELRGIPSLFGRHLVLPRFRVVSPTVVFEIFDDGTSNFSRLLAGKKGGAEGGLEVSLSEAVVQRATLRFRDWKARVDAIVEDAAFTSQGRWFGATSHLELRARKARLRINDYETLECALGIAADLSPGRLRIQDLHLRGPQLSLDAFGGIDNLRHPSIQLFPTVETRGEELGKLFGIGLPLTGKLRVKGSLFIPEEGGVEGRGSFDLPDGSFGPFRMKAAGLLHVDQAGVLVQVTRAEYGGGTLEAQVRVERLRNPPLPVDLVVHGRGIGFERFLADLGLPGTGMIGRADLDSTLTWGRGGIERASGAGSLKVVADTGAPEVQGRHPLPTSGGGPLLVREGQILFDRMSFVTKGGLHTQLDGSIAIGSWTPDLTIRAEASDLTELDRTAENWYAAIQGEPLEPPLGLEGSGRIEAHLTRAFGDPRIEGSFKASGLLLRGVRFGEASTAFTVDRRVASFAPFAATDGPASLSVTGEIGWGGSLGSHYRLQDLVTEVRAWPLERLLRFLDIDLPMSGPVSGRLPLSGVTPALTGRAPIVWEKASAWGQRIDRVEGALAFEGDRIRISGAEAALDGGTATGEGFYRWGDGGFEVSLDIAAVPLGAVGKVAESAPQLAGRVTARLAGEGTLAKPTLTLSGSLAETRWGESVLGEPGRPIVFSARMKDGAWSAGVEIPGAASFTATTPASPKSATSIRLTGEHLAPFSAVIGLPAEAGFDGRLDLSATLRPPAGEASWTGEGELATLAATLWGHTISIRRPVPFRIGQGRIAVDRAELAEIAGPGGEKPLAPSTATLEGYLGLDAPYPLEISASASVNANLLGPLVAPAALSGRLIVEGKAAGTALKPELTGRATLEGIDVKPSGGAPFEAIRGTVIVAGGHVTARDVSLRYSGGTIDLNASAALEGLRMTGLRAALRLAKLRIEPMSGFSAIVSGDIRLEGDSAIRSARGEVVVDRALYAADVGLTLGSLLSGRRSVVVASVAGPFDAIALDVRIVLPPSSIEVRNDVARLKLSGDLLLRGNVGRPVLFGQLEAETGGRLRLRDQNYDLDSGKIVFSNPSRIEPFFDVDAETSIRTSGGDYRVRVVVTGTPERLAARFSSDPQLPEAQIISLLATGALPPSAIPGAGGSSTASSDASVSQAARDLLAGLATEALTSRTKEFFRLDRLQIDPNFQGSSFTGPRVTVGKTFGKNFTATIAYQFGSANNAQQQVISLEYE